MERRRTDWEEIRRLFEMCSGRPRDEWHALLRAECDGRAELAFEALSLLVASEGLPPLDEAA